MGDCTEGARATTAQGRNGEALVATSDRNGDFWLHDLAPSEYAPVVVRRGHLPQQMGPVDASKDIKAGETAGWRV